MEASPTPSPNGAIVVGVDGSDTADRAVAWAVRYAALEDLPLVIAHGVAAISTPEGADLHFDRGGATLALVDEQLRAGGEAVVAAATGKVAESPPLRGHHRRRRGR